MDILLLLLITLGIGYVWGKSTNTTKTNELRLSISERLHHLATTESDEIVRARLHAVADSVRDEAIEPAAQSQPVEPPKKVPPSVQPVAAAATSQAQHQLDSVSVLLYFGAFLLLAGVALFVGLSDFDGHSKTLAVVVLAGIFYSAGLYLYERIERLKPAALAFTAIGLLTLPLAGVAAYSYVFTHAGSWVWLVTSAVSLVLYSFALWRIRQSFIGYLSVFMCLSLWLSIVAVIQVPVYYFGWAAILLGMAYLVVARRASNWPELEQPLSVSASVMVPTAMLLLLFAGESMGIINQGISLALTAAFYALACWLELKDERRQPYFLLAYSLVPIAVGVIEYGFDESFVAASFALSAAVAAGAGFLRATKLPNDWQQLGLTINTVFLGIAALLCAGTGDWVALTWLLAFNLLLFIGMVYSWRRTLELTAGLFTLLLLPFVFGNGVVTPGWEPQYFSLTYLLLAGLFAASMHQLRAIPHAFAVLTSGFVLALSLAWLHGLAAPDILPGLISLVAGLLVMHISYRERSALSLTATTLLGVVAVLQLLISQAHSPSTIAYVLTVLGIGYVAIGRSHTLLQRPLAHGDTWIGSGLVLLYMVALFGFLAGGSTPWPGITALAAAGIATGVEAWLRKERLALYGAGGVMLTAAQLAIAELGFHEWQLYWYMWTIYLLFFAYKERIAAALPVSAGILVAGITHGLATHHSLSPSAFVVTILSVSLACYAAGKLLPLWGEGKATLAYTGIAGAYLAALIPAGTNPNHLYETVNNGEAWLNALALMSAGALTTYEAYLARNRGTLYVGGGIVLAGLQWLIHSQGAQELQLYTHMWAGYFGLLAWHAGRANRHDERQLFTGLGLGILTIPLALEALGGNTTYGLVLLLESTGLVLLGLWLKDTLISRWGLVGAVGSVLYQLRDYQFFVLALLGAGIIALSVYLLLKREKR